MISSELIQFTVDWYVLLFFSDINEYWSSKDSHFSKLSIKLQLAIPLIELELIFKSILTFE